MVLISGELPETVVEGLFRESSPAAFKRVVA